MYRGWNRWNDEGFTFWVSDVSISWGYLLVQMPLWQTLYLHRLNIRCCRCFFWDRCIRNLLFFKLADTFQPACHVKLHLHHMFSITWGCFSLKLCILNVLFQCLADTPHQNFISSIPENSLSQMPSPKKNILWVLFTSQLEPIHYLQKNWYKKFERIWGERWRHLERKFICF